jgi:hypothetical protein
MINNSKSSQLKSVIRELLKDLLPQGLAVHHAVDVALPQKLVPREGILPIRAVLYFLRFVAVLELAP